MTQEDRESFQCVMEHMGGLESMAATFGGNEEAAFMELFTASFACGLELEGPAG